ncbi:hypothetical protein JCM16358_05570 [Halanaerocella petrolearia]
MNYTRKSIICLLCMLTLSLLITGCSDDGTSDLYSGDVIKNVEGPKAIIYNDSNPVEFSVDTNITNPSYQWIVSDDESLASFENPKQSSTTLTANQKEGQVDIRVKVSDGQEDTYSDWSTIRILGEKNETIYGGEEPDGFHAIVPAKDTGFTGYIAAGYRGMSDVTKENGFQKDGYVIKANKRGVRRWSKTVDGGGYDDRFVAVESIVNGFFKDEYFLVGYQGVTGDTYEGYIMRVDRDGKLSKEYTGLQGDRVFLRSATVDDYLVVAGNDGTTDQAQGYIAKLDPNKEDETDPVKNRIQINGNNYTNLYGIEKTDNGSYLVAGFTGDNKDDTDGEITQGFIAKLNSDLTMSATKQVGLGNRLYTIEPLSSSGEFIVAGENSGQGYIAKVDTAGNVSKTDTYSQFTKIRAVLELSDGGYMLVGTKNGTEGRVVKVKSDYTLDTSFDDDGIATYGSYLDDITKSEDGNYLLAGYKVSADGDRDAYVVKINESGTIVTRNN